MRKVLAGILIFDVVMGILCLVVGTRQYAGDRQLNTREGKIQGLRETLAGDVNCEEELAQKIALTFDDGPHPKYTEQLLDGLKERNVAATFFVMEKQVSSWTPLRMAVRATSVAAFPAPMTITRLPRR